MHATVCTSTHYDSFMSHTETWLPVVGFEGHYEVSDQGRVKTLKTDVATGGRILKPQVIARYYYVGLWKNGKLKQSRLHRLVLLAFVGPCPEGMECLHGPGGKFDNRLSNLRWGTRSENMQEQVASGNHVEARKTHCPHGHPYNEENTYVRPDGRGRGCLICLRSRARETARRESTGPRVYILKTHCLRGHEFTPENTYTPPRGGRQCRECNQINKHKRGDHFVSSNLHR